MHKTNWAIQSIQSITIRAKKASAVNKYAILCNLKVTLSDWREKFTHVNSNNLTYLFLKKMFLRESLNPFFLWPPMVVTLRLSSTLSFLSFFFFFLPLLSIEAPLTVAFRPGEFKTLLSIIESLPQILSLCRLGFIVAFGNMADWGRCFRCCSGTTGGLVTADFGLLALIPEWPWPEGRDGPSRFLRSMWPLWTVRIIGIHNWTVHI